MKTSVIILCLFAMFSLPMGMRSQEIVKLWENPPRVDNGLSGDEAVEGNNNWISNISNPEIHIYRADKTKNTGMSVIICPGGGYAGLSFNSEGVEFAKWLNTLGITGIVLKYRLPNKHKKVPLDDAQQAISYVRSHAKELGIDQHLIGIAGFSAGGHLAATASTHFSMEGISTRPDFTLLFYPVVTMNIPTLGGTKPNLLGDKPSAIDLYTFSNENQVNVNTPPAILLLSDDDRSVPPVNSTLYYDALKNNGIPASIYIFPEGGHGWGMNKNFKYHDQMLSLLEAWLKDRLKNN